MEREVEKERERIIQKLKENGYRITKQRLKILDVILENHCSSCKEIFFYALKRDEKIGIATVYRMVSALEEVGVISRKIVYASEQNSGKDEAEKISDKKFQ